MRRHKGEIRGSGDGFFPFVRCPDEYWECVQLAKKLGNRVELKFRCIYMKAGATGESELGRCEKGEYEN